MSRPVQNLKKAVAEVAAQNGISGKPSEVYLGDEMAVIRIREPRIIEHLSSNEMGLDELIEAHQKEVAEREGGKK